MIRIHTGGCPKCGSPIFVDFDVPDQVTYAGQFSGPDKEVTPHYVFQDSSFYGKIKEVIYSCECVVKAEPETEPEKDNE